MTKNKVKVFLISAFLIIGICCYQNQPPKTNVNNTNAGNTNAGKTAIDKASVANACDASADWLSNPSMPDVITENGTTCPFHQFSWQTFIALMNQGKGSNERAFQDEKPFPLLQADGVNSCDETKSPVQSRLFVRNSKDDNGPGDDFILPERIKQAAKEDQAVIYDQNGNVVFYEVRFSRSECTTDKAATMFPAGTTELKVSYRVITEADKPNYIWINADINGDGKIDNEKEMLGMIGFHLVKSTAEHPEFIWASFEHKQNAPECVTKPDPYAKWSFTSAQCSAELPNSVDTKLCDFNMADTHAALSGGKPTQICKVYHDGSRQGDIAFGDNVGAIDALNTQLNGLIAKLPASSPLSVLKNYQLIGTLWLIDPNKSSQIPGQPTTDTSNQVGSIQLANPTMETTFQQFKVGAGGDAEPVGYTGNTNLQPAANCFFCHRYDAGDPAANPPTPRNNVKTSHIFPAIFGTTK